MSILDVEHLTITTHSGKKLVEDVHLTITQGTIHALVGESGSGKSLTALAIMGLLPADLVCEVQFNPPIPLLRGKDIGMIFQEPMTALNPLHTIGAQIAESIRIYNPTLRKAAIKQRVAALLEQVGLGYFTTRLTAYPHQLSGGERQRVMIAMAIANHPRLLIADEPTTALDVTVQAQILALLQDLSQNMGMAILLITHDLPLVRRIAHDISIMTQGRIVEQGSTEKLFAKPEHHYTQKLLAAQANNPPLSAPPASEVVLECSGLCVQVPKAIGLFAWKNRTVSILEHIDFSLAKGMTLGIVGESGSGKTTLALALLRLIPSQGKIIFLGNPLHSFTGRQLRSLRKQLQVVFQDPFASLNPRLTIEQTLREGLDIHEPTLSPAQKIERIDNVLSDVGLTPDMKTRYPHAFSGGQRQRICLARALILKPTLLILDEPTSALDVSVQMQILGLLKDLQASYGLTTIFISHDLRTVRTLCHFILVLRHGKMVEYNTAENIFLRPQDDYTKNLLSAAFL